MPTAPRATKRSAQGSAKKKPAVKVQSRAAKAVRIGVYRDMRGGMTIDEDLSANGKAAPLSQSVAEGTKKAYASAFVHWVVWRRVGGLPLLLERTQPGAWEDELCELYAHIGHTMGYSWSYCHSVLYSIIRRVHRLARANLDI